MLKDDPDWTINETLLNSVLPENKQRALEIGVFRGHATRKLAPLFEQVFCVDPLDDFYILENPNLSLVPGNVYNNQYSYFTQNTKHIQDKIKLFRNKSTDILPKLSENYFDFIFIDGDHREEAVYFDLVESHRLLKNNGVILIDNMDWRGDQPHKAVEKFLKNFGSDYKVVYNTLITHGVTSIDRSGEPQRQCAIKKIITNKSKLIVPPTARYPGSLGDKAILLSIEKNNADLLVCNTEDSFWQDLNFKNIIDINRIDIKKYDEVHFYPTDIIDGAFGDESIDLFHKISSLFTNIETKIFFNTFSYGPNPSQKSIDYLKKLNAIFSLRDQYSLERFKKFYPNHLCFLQPDPAFNLEAIKPKEEVNIPSNSVGICPANHEYDKYSKILELCIKKGYNPVLILHDLRPDVGDISLCDKLSENYNISIIPTKDPREIKYLLSKMSFVITGRMHVAILAMGAGTKAYGFDYNNKMKGIFRVKNQENNVIQTIEEIYEIKS